MIKHLFSYISLIAIIIILSNIAFAHQLEKGKKEVSIAIGFQPQSVKGKTNIAISIPIRVGYLITNRLEAEPEFVFTDFEDGDTDYSIIVNIAYNFGVYNKVVPFTLAGGGFTNGTSITGELLQLGDEINGVINVGGGVKYLVGANVAFRLEYRYQRIIREERFCGEVNYNPYLNIHNISLGFSLFL